VATALACVILLSSKRAETHDLVDWFQTMPPVPRIRITGFVSRWMGASGGDDAELTVS